MSEPLKYGNNYWNWLADDHPRAPDGTFIDKNADESNMEIYDDDDEEEEEEAEREEDEADTGNDLINRAIDSVVQHAKTLGHKFMARLREVLADDDTIKYDESDTIGLGKGEAIKPEGTIKYSAWAWEEALHPRGHHGKWRKKGEVDDDDGSDIINRSIDSILKLGKTLGHKFMAKLRETLADDDTISYDEGDTIKLGEDEAEAAEGVVSYEPKKTESNPGLHLHPKTQAEADYYANLYDQLDDEGVEGLKKFGWTAAQRPGSPMKYAWDSAKHKRGDPKNKGRFYHGGGGELEGELDDAGTEETVSPKYQDMQLPESRPGEDAGLDDELDMLEPTDHKGRLRNLLSGGDDEDADSLLEELANLSPEELSKLREETQTVGDIAGFMDRISKPDGGFTYQPYSHLSPKTGCIVSAYPERSQGFDVDKLKLSDMAAYVMKNNDMWDDSEHYFGAWHDPDTNRVILDVVQVFNDPQKAADVGRESDQKSYFDLETGKPVSINPNATSGGQTSGKRKEKTAAPSPPQPDGGAARQPVREADGETPERQRNSRSASRYGAPATTNQRRGVNHASGPWKEQEGSELEHQDGDGRWQATEASRRHRAVKSREEQQEEVVAQTRERIKAARDRAQTLLTERSAFEEHQEAKDYERLRNARREAEERLASLWDMEYRVRYERRETRKDSELRDLIEVLKTQAERPILVNPVINLPEIKIPMMPEIKIPAAAPVNIVVEKPDPVVVNFTPPKAEHFDIKPVRDENGTVISYRRMTK